MIEPYEQFAITRYLLKLISYGRLPAKALGEICEFLERNSSFLGLDPEDQTFLEQLDEFQRCVSEKSGVRPAYGKTLSVIENRLDSRLDVLKTTPPGHMESNLKVLADELDLDMTELSFFGFLVRYHIHDNFQRVINEITREHLSVYETCASCLGLDSAILAEKIRPKARLMATGIICQPGRSGNDLDDHFEVPDMVQTGLQKACGVREDILSYILGKPTDASLEWEDFEHLDDMRDRIAAYLKTALDKQVAGVNILFWGPPGTGKTEFCKTLARHLDVTLYAIGEKDEDGQEPNRRERTSSLQLAQNLLRYQNKSLLMFDEMDDLFEGNALATLFGIKVSCGSKVFTNRLFENNPIPTLWIINDPQTLDTAIIRRMSLAIEITIPPLKTREKVWQRVLEKNAMSLPPHDTHELAKLDIPPAVIDNAARVAKQIGGSVNDFRFAVHGLMKAMSGKAPQKTEEKSNPFCLALIHADLDLDRLTKQLYNTGHLDFSLCLYGPSGTGKSAYIRHLAETLELPILFKRASDLMDAYVGNSEKNIATAFQEAKDREAFLVFDEADSLLGDRRYAVRNWEISQVNEMLTWMESHPLPFACTTNLRERLDGASLRRFTFKSRFDYLTPDQIVLAFREFFTLQLPDTDPAGLRGLTPGDFALVRKKVGILGCDKDSQKIVAMLKTELKEKGISPGGKPGFCRS